MAAHSILPLVLTFLLTISLFHAIPSTTAIPPPPWKPVQDLNAPDVQSIARFAVGEINKQTGTGYLYVKILVGDHQLLPHGAINYRLKVQVKDPSGLLDEYEAVVLHTPWDNAKKLTSTKLLTPWVPISNLNDPQVQAVGIYAVLEINRKSSIFFRQYFYVNVVKGETKTLSAGVKYYRLLVRVRLGLRLHRNVQVVANDNPRQLLSSTFLF